MDEQRVREILKDAIQPDNSIEDSYQYASWSPVSDIITLDGHFTIERLEAIIWWMKNHAVLSPTWREEKRGHGPRT